MLQTFPTDPGLQSLQRIISILSDAYAPHYNINLIPYAQSVLTTLLKDSFGGRAKTVLLCCVSPLLQDYNETLYTLNVGVAAQSIKNVVTVNSYTTYETVQENLDVFGLQFAANQLFKLVSNAEELFQRLITSGTLSKTEMDQVSQWLMLKQECEDCLSEDSEPHRSLERIEEEIEDSYESSDSSEVVENDSTQITDKLDELMENFRSRTDKLIAKSITNDEFIISFTKDSLNGSNNYRMKGARGRRASIHSVEDLTSSLSINSSKISEEDITLETEHKVSHDAPLTVEAMKRMVKQITAAIHVNILFNYC